MQLGEAEWPEDEAVGAVEEFIASYNGTQKTAETYLRTEATYWEKCFEDDNLMARFVTAFNNSNLLREFKEVNDLQCKMEWEPKQAQIPFEDHSLE